MAYYNDASNADHYSFVPGGAYSYQSPCQTFVTETERTYEQIYTGPTDQWSVVRQSGPMIGSSTSLWATDSFESVAPTTSYTSGTDNCWPSYDWSAAYRQAQSYPSGYLNGDVSFTNTAASETPLDYQRADWNGTSTSTSYMGNVNTSNWQWTGPTEPETTRARRFHPYAVPRTRPNLYENAEAGPSTLAAISVPYIGPPTIQPSGGISERRADAQTTHQTSENSRVPPTLTRTPRGYGEPRRSRVESGKECQRLCEWVQQRGTEPPTVNQALAVAVMIIRAKRVPVYPKPCLVKGTTGRTASDSRSIRKERERRRVERILYQKLSRHYPLPQGKKEWARPALLVKAFNDIKDLERGGELEDLEELKNLRDFKDLKDLEVRETLEDLDDPEDVPVLPAIPEPSNESPS